MTLTSTIHTIFNSPLGMVYVEANGVAVTRIRTLPTNDPMLYVRGERKDNHPLLMQAKAELESYFFYQGQEFSVPVDMAGSDFDKLVWDTLINIPYAHVATYSEIAEIIGKPRAARAVGSACRRNPIWLIVPCHRVIGTDKKLRGYAGGLEKKQWLLNHEECVLKRAILEDKAEISSLKI